MIASARPEDLRAAPATAGKPAPGTQIRILDERFDELPVGEIGQIFVRSGTLFGGYTSGKTKGFHDGFMASGDIGYFDEGGRLFVVGRDDEMIISGGENIYPIEVEKALMTHPAVTEAVVLGVEDEKYGQRLVGFVIPRSAKQLRRMHSSNMCGRHLRATKCHEKSSCSTICPEMRLERFYAQRCVRISTDPERSFSRVCGRHRGRYRGQPP